VAGAAGEESNREVRPPARGSAFPRGLRLLRHVDFERVYKLGARHFSRSLTAFYLVREEASRRVPARPVASGLRVGFTVGRSLGGAVQRNRIKRRLREAVRNSRLPEGLGVDVVINPKKSLLTADFGAVVNEVRHAFVTIGEKLAKNSR